LTIKEFADGLNGRNYMNEITPIEEQRAKELGIVIMYGYSDDNVELRGYIDEEVGAYDGTTVYLDKDGVFELDCDCCSEECKLLREHLKECRVVEAVWDADGYSWVFQTDIPHETFDVYDDGEKYCRGIVFEWPFDRE